MTFNAELAWAAGFFDAEGCTCAGRNRAQGTLKPHASISQSGRPGCPDTLTRFRAAVGVGAIRGPSKGGVYYWATDSASDYLLAVSKIWPWLGSQKRAQFLRCTSRLASYHRLRFAKTRSPRTLRTIANFSALRASLAFDTSTRNDHEVAWAAGLFDGEGSMTVKRRTWKTTVFYSISAGVPQGGGIEVPEVLVRFQHAVAMGAIYGPGKWRNAKLLAYDWHLTQPGDVRRLMETLWPHLGLEKRGQAVASFKLYDSRSHRTINRRRDPRSTARWLDRGDTEGLSEAAS